MKKQVLLFLILILGAIFRLYQLDSLPGEMWGDVAEGFEFTQFIFDGKWPWYFVLGNGPLFFYFAAVPSLLLGLSFFSLKLSSVLIGLALIFVTYVFAKELAGTKVALLTSLFIAVSRWPVTLSRLGMMIILVPFTVIVVFYLLLKAFQTNRLRYWIGSGLTLGIGLYNYPVFAMVMPITIFVVGICFLLVQKSKSTRYVKGILLACAAFFLIAFSFIQMIWVEKDVWFAPGSYFASKLVTADGTLLPDWNERLIDNIKRSAGMFHIQGHSSFRVNVSNVPHLDSISGVFFLIGLVWCVVRMKKYRYLVFIPLLLLQLPQILVLNVPGDVPNAGRSSGVIPFTYFLVAMGLMFYYKVLRRFHIPLFFSIPLILIIFAHVVYVNTFLYFVTYAYGLPNQNTAYSKILARHIDALPQNVSIYLGACCWGDWGQPDGKPIYFSLSNRKRNVVNQRLVSSCEDIDARPAEVILSPKEKEKAALFDDCGKGTVQTDSENGQEIYSYIEIPKTF
ncbi:glycosyltransferase family 39 protein [Candidatus Gottesmanbacteria bacterium]|nr:glycosyltransferase family 39 protein [Candidatus Gottesmanbacteria bacterium]